MEMGDDPEDTNDQFYEFDLHLDNQEQFEEPVEQDED